MPPEPLAAGASFAASDPLPFEEGAGASSIIDTPASGSFFEAFVSTTSGSADFSLAAEDVDLTVELFDDFADADDLADDALFAAGFPVLLLLEPVAELTDLLTDVAVLLTDDLTELISFVTDAVVPAISDFSPAISLSTLDFRSLTLTPVCFSNSPVMSVVIRRKSRISLPA